METKNTGGYCWKVRPNGLLPVMEHGDLVGMLTFREVIHAVMANGGSVGERRVRSVMDDAPLTCTPETEIDDVRRMMPQRHARYSRYSIGAR